MKRPVIVRLLVAVAALLLVTASVQADPITQNSTNNGFYNIEFFAPFGQTFTAEDALIDTVGVFAIQFQDTADPFSLRYDLYSGVGANVAPIASRTFTGPGSFQGFADVSFFGIPLAPGTTYSLILSGSSRTAVLVGAGNGNPYPGGVALFLNAPREPLDLAFHVLPAATPEPTTVTLLAVGIARFAAKRYGRGRPTPAQQVKRP